MRMRFVILAAALAGCSTPKPGAKPSPEQPIDRSTGVEAEPALVIEPLVPNEELPPGSDLLYDFAHFVIPLVVFSSPRDKVREQFLGPTANRFLKRQWEVLHREPPTEFPTAENVTLEVGEAALIVMPTPQRNAQAYFTLIVFKNAGPVRYMTLERSVFMKDDGPDRTVIGEWTVEEGSPKHSSFGEGPPPQREAFLTAVIEYLH